MGIEPGVAKDDETSGAADGRGGANPVEVAPPGAHARTGARDNPRDPAADEHSLLWHWNRATAFERYNRGRFTGQDYFIEAADEALLVVRYVLHRGEAPIPSADSLARRLKSMSVKVPTPPVSLLIHVEWTLKPAGPRCTHDRVYRFEALARG